MKKNTLIKDIKEKGNGQAIIYVSKIDLVEHNLNFGDSVRLTKVKKTITITEIKK